MILHMGDKSVYASNATRNLTSAFNSHSRIFLKYHLLKFGGVHRHCGNERIFWFGVPVMACPEASLIYSNIIDRRETALSSMSSQSLVLQRAQGMCSW